MSTARARVTVTGPVAAAEELWYDVRRWPGWVDGFARVVRRDPGWPREGSLVWDSRPEGRGRVVERVERWSPREGQRAAVEDPKLRGVQEIAFAPRGGEVEVELTLDYELKDRRAVMRLTDLLFIRRAQRDSLRRMLVRFARERSADSELTAPE